MTLQVGQFTNSVGTYLQAHYPIDIARGVDHLIATARAFAFVKQGGNQWPNLTGYTVQMELKIRGVTAIAGAGTVIHPVQTSSPLVQARVDVEVLATAFDESRIPNGTGTFQVIGIDPDENRVLLATGIATLHPDTRPGSLD